jgi:low affinity Fe/Cu permease
VTSFHAIARKITDAAGHPVSFGVATVVCGAWIATDRPFDWLDAVSALTLWMLFALQHSSNTDTAAIQAKLDSILLAIPEADDDLRGIERKS